MTDYLEQIESYLGEERRVVEALDRESINTAMNVLVEKAKGGATIYVMGNGGSSATASHFVCDFAKGVYMGTGLPFKMVCLSDNTPIATAISNDIGYESVFEFQLRDRVQEGDLVIAISGSGNSKNIINAAKYAKQCGAEIMSLTGYDGGELKALSDYPLHVPINNMQIVEDVHMMFDHLMMYVLCSEAEVNG